MGTNEFRKLFEDNCKRINLEKFKTSFYIESNDSIVFLILRKSSYSSKYYLRIKTNLKPIENNFDKNEFIKHDISDIILSIDSLSPEIFNLENQLNDFDRNKKMFDFYSNEVDMWIQIFLNKNSIIEYHKKGNLFLLPHTKTKLNLQ